MKLIASLFGLLILTIPELVAVPNYWHFHTIFWSTHAIAVGRVVAIESATGKIDIEVQEWIRGGHQEPKTRIRAFRGGVTLCGGHKPYVEVGSDYLLFLHSPVMAPGVEKQEEQRIIIRFELTGSPFCIRTDLDPTKKRVLLTQTTDGCDRKVSHEEVLDAVRTFDQCFELSEGTIDDTIPSRQVCSDQMLSQWASRSHLHKLLANEAVKRIADRDPGV